MNMLNSLGFSIKDASYSTLISKERNILRLLSILIVNLSLLPIDMHVPVAMNELRYELVDPLVLHCWIL